MFSQAGRTTSCALWCEWACLWSWVRGQRKSCRRLCSIHVARRKLLVRKSEGSKSLLAAHEAFPVMVQEMLKGCVPACSNSMGTSVFSTHSSISSAIQPEFHRHYHSTLTENSVFPSAKCSEIVFDSFESKISEKKISEKKKFEVGFQSSKCWCWLWFSNRWGFSVLTLLIAVNVSMNCKEGTTNILGNGFSGQLVAPPSHSFRLQYDLA